MCGILGYTGTQPAAQILLDGLSRLEYRGYDSTGIAIVGPDGKHVIHNSAGKLSSLKTSLGNNLPDGIIGIGHTRWATHGGPTDFNAHPHMDCKNDVIVVHNGIVENYVELKEELISSGHIFTSQTDAGCIPHLIESYLAKQYSLEDAVRETTHRIRGSNAAVVISKQDANAIVAFRLGNAGGIVVGYGDNEMIVASDLPALIPHTKDVVYLANKEIVRLTRTTAQYSMINGDSIQKNSIRVPYEAIHSAKGEYKHFMAKEINEQPEAVLNTLRGRVSFDNNKVEFEDFPFSVKEVCEFNRIVIVGMGTSLHAAMVGRTWMESLTGITTEVDNSSEFRYRNPIIDSKTLFISLSQSGETADTLAAMEEAERKGARQITLCNYAGTQTTRIADGTILIRAGLETGVAASKTFLCSMTALYLLALDIAIKRGTIEQDRLQNMIKELSRLPHMLGTLLSNQKQYEKLSKQYYKCTDFLFLGRGINYPIAMEGALKLKEISYIHAEGYPAGEMKHGPISLIDENMPVVVLIPQDSLYEKLLNNINEVKARGGIVIAVANEEDNNIDDKSDQIIRIPKASSMITPMLMSVPMQLLAYHIGVRRGCDVDQPRNLAKSVTVE